ncbi:MAG: hypothetical protein OEU93_12250 [Rubrivivax sp.]|nr:hypothetical protein [Rubrivivax sp.]
MTRTDDADPPAVRLPLPAAAELQDDLLVASCDLERLQRLLADASGDLIGHFHAATDELQALLRAASDREDPAELHRVLAQVTGAITAMQFQDMASQLISHTSHRLRVCADRLAREAMGDDDDEQALPDAPPLRPNPVSQHEMDAGSIELF